MTAPPDAPQENQPPFHANNVGPNGEGLRYESSVLDELVAEAQEQDMGYGTEDYPHVNAAFINAIAEEGTKAEAVEWLQREQLARMYWQEQARELAEALKRMESERDENWQRYVDADAALLDAQEKREAMREAWRLIYANRNE